MISSGNNVFALNIKYLLYTGLWSNDGWSRNRIFLYILYKNILHIIAALYVIFVTVGCYQNRHDFTFLMDNLVKTLVGYNYFIKSLFFVKTSGDLRILIDDITTSGDIISEKRDRIMYLLVLGSTVFPLSIVTSFALLAFIDNELPVEIWLPFDVQKSFLNLVTGHQIIVTMFLILQLRSVAMQGIVCSLMMYICDQLLELQTRIKMLQYSLDRDKEIRKEFKAIIIKHVRLRRYGRIMMKVFKNFFLIQNLAVTVEMCLNAFMVTVIGLEQKNLLATFAAFLLVALLNAYIFCYLGNEVILKSTGIALAAYETDWISWPTNLRKDLCTVILVSQRPLYLSAGGLAVMSIQTFAQTLYNGYTIFAVLQDAMKRH